MCLVRLPGLNVASETISKRSTYDTLYLNIQLHRTISTVGAEGATAADLEEAYKKVRGVLVGAQQRISEGVHYIDVVDFRARADR